MINKVPLVFIFNNTGMVGAGSSKVIDCPCKSMDPADLCLYSNQYLTASYFHCCYGQHRSNSRCHFFYVPMRLQKPVDPLGTVISPSISIILRFNFAWRATLSFPIDICLSIIVNKNRRIDIVATRTGPVFYWKSESTQCICVRAQDVIRYGDPISRVADIKVELPSLSIHCAAHA